MNVIKQIAMNVSTNLGARAERWIRSQGDALAGRALVPAATAAHAVSKHAIDYINSRGTMPDAIGILLKTWDMGDGISMADLLTASKADPKGVVAFLTNAATRKVINADLARLSRAARAGKQWKMRSPTEERQTEELNRILRGVDAVFRGGLRKVG